ncbi:MAG: hypothetical protein IKF19_04140 [Bacilli bacterium]|nr:hypothetical protein [Bacilli bacterium]
MKKLLVSLFIIFLMSGCGNNKTLKCTTNRSANSISNDTEAKIEYQDTDVKFVTITYDYNQDENSVTGNATVTTTDHNDMTTTTTIDNSGNDVDGMNADTDGMTNDNNTSSNEVVDGAVGDTIDTIIGGVTDTILDIAGIKNTYENRLSTYDNIEGFSYKVDVDEDNEYKVVYKIDMDKISDSDLARFNLDKNLNTLKSNYEGLGYTCEEK